MRSRPFIHVLALAGLLILVRSTQTSAQFEDPLPILTGAELACQNAISDSTHAYMDSVLQTRHDCFFFQMRGEIPLAIDCRASVDVGTGDTLIDERLRTAENKLLADVTTKCLAIQLEILDFPGLCIDDDGPPFTAFDLERCLRRATDNTVNELLAIEQPDAVAMIENPQRNCQDTISRKSAGMFTAEFKSRANCSYQQLKQPIVLADLDCRAEVERDAPGTGRGRTDQEIIEAHNKVLRQISNACPQTDLTTLGFPNECPSGVGNTFPLFSLVECMFVSHHRLLVPFIDVANPLTKNCGNGLIDDLEECDDGDDLWTPGDVCLATCNANFTCGGPLGLGRVSINDALFILRAAVGLETCDLSLCDVDNNGVINTSDVLAVLRFVVGLPVELMCPDPILPGEPALLY